MHYYIDGYNLMFRILHAGDTLQSQRERVIEDLYIKILLLELSVTIIFDSQYQEGESSRTHRKHLEILFTAQGETADDLILEMIKKAPKPQHNIVVTSDKKLAWLVRRRAGKTETVEEFIQWLNKRYQNKLRQRKEQSKPVLVEDIIPKKIVRKTSVEKPSENALPEDCLEFYLNTFEKQVREADHIKEIKKHLNSPHKAKLLKDKVKKETNPSIESDMDRWLREFEKKPTDT